MKPLKPSMREKKRYLLLSGSFTRKDVENANFKVRWNTWICQSISDVDKR